MSINPEWLSKNSLRSFPISEDAKPVSLSGIELPNSIILDLSISSSLDASTRFFIRSVTSSPKMLSISICDQNKKSLAVATAIKGTDTIVDLNPLIEGIVGSVVFGDGVNTFPEGFHDFVLSAPLEARCGISIGPFPVKSLSALHGNKMNGDVSILGGDQLRLEIFEMLISGKKTSAVRMSLSNMSKFLSPCENLTTTCDCDKTPIRSINGVMPDENGKIYIEVRDDNGSVSLIDAHTLGLLLTRNSTELCIKPEVPDEYGRLASASGDYDSDQIPITPYRADGDTTFPTPPK